MRAFWFVEGGVASTTDKSGKYRGRILRPIPYEDGSGTQQVAPVGSYDIAEVGEHLQFFGEGFDPFQMPRKHALQHHKVGNLEIEDWQS